MGETRRSAQRDQLASTLTPDLARPADDDPAEQNHEEPPLQWRDSAWLCRRFAETIEERRSASKTAGGDTTDE